MKLYFLIDVMCKLIEFIQQNHSQQSFRLKLPLRLSEYTNPSCNIVATMSYVPSF